LGLSDRSPHVDDQQQHAGSAVRAFMCDELSAGPLKLLSPPVLRRCWSGSVMSARRTSDAAALIDPSL
jgi:hypothetical protein